MCKTKSEDQQQIFIYLYFNKNNQYDWGMSQFLPFGNFNWVDINIDSTSISDDSPVGYICEVHLKYPRHLLHIGLPFCPERRAAV